MLQINLLVKTLKGSRLSIKIDNDETYLTFLKKVAEQLECKLDQLHMFMMNVNGRYTNGMLGLPLVDNQTLEEQGIKDGTIFDCQVLE